MKPTKEGLYWYKYNDSPNGWLPAHVHDSYGKPPLVVSYMGTEIEDYLEDVNGEWGSEIYPPGHVFMSPSPTIPPPSGKQVFICDGYDESGKAINGTFATMHGDGSWTNQNGVRRTSGYAIRVSESEKSNTDHYKYIHLSEGKSGAIYLCGHVPDSEIGGIALDKMCVTCPKCLEILNQKQSVEETGDAPPPDPK